MGYIVVIEGTDGSGKQTQTEMLYTKLVGMGYDVMRQSFPAYDCPSSAPVKMYLAGEFGNSDMSLDAYQASVLYSVDRLCIYNKYLKDFYENGGIILFDRYVSSDMLHQAGKISDKEKRDKYLEWLDHLEYDTLKLPRPNKVIFLNVPVEVSEKLAHERVGLKNQQAKDIHELSHNHLERSYEAGKYVSTKYNWCEIDCVEGQNLKSREQIHSEICSAVLDDILALDNVSRK